MFHNLIMIDNSNQIDRDIVESFRLNVNVNILKQ
jgi:hypothetical protein